MFRWGIPEFVEGSCLRSHVARRDARGLWGETFCRPERRGCPAVERASEDGALRACLRGGEDEREGEGKGRPEGGSCGSDLIGRG